MKQHPQAPRGKPTTQQHFEYIEFPKAHRRELEERDKRRTKLDRVRGVRASEYFAVSNDQQFIQASLYDGSISNSVEISSQTTPEVSRDASEPHHANAVKTAAQSESQPPIIHPHNSVPHKQQNPYKQLSAMPTPLENKYKFSSNTSPFKLPSIISEIKPKDYNRYSGRNSEKFLLDLLNAEPNGSNEEEEKPVVLAEVKETKKEEPVIEKIEVNVRKSIRMYERIQSKPDPKKDTSSKGRRVTINDKGKIKFTNESVSADYQRIIPSQLREELQQSRKRRLSIHEDDGEDDGVIPRKDQEEPMDIVDPQRQAQEIAELKNKEFIQKAQDILHALSQNPVKLVQKPKDKENDRRSKVVRICEKTNNQEEVKSKDKDKQDSRKLQSSKARPAGSKNKKGSQVIQNSKPVQSKKTKGRPRSDILPVSQKGRKLQKSQKQSGQKIENSDQPSLNIKSRPERVRVPPKAFWAGEKIFHSKDMQTLCKNTLKGIVFLQILGFNSPQKIELDGQMMFSNNTIETMIRLHPKQMIYSTGVNTSAMKKNQVNKNYFKGLSIQLVTALKDKQKDKIKCLIDDITEVRIYEKDMEISVNQTFSLENESTEKAFVFHITLYGNKPKNEKDEEDEDEEDEEDEDKS